MTGSDLLYQARSGPVWRSLLRHGHPRGARGRGGDRQRAGDRPCSSARARPVSTPTAASTAPWTRPSHEFVAPVRHVHRRRVRAHRPPAHAPLRHPPEALATVAATIRNNGHVNPEACYFGRGPFTVQDILDSRMVADPFHLLDCSMTAEGGCALVLTRADIARDLADDPIWVLGGNTDHFGPSYQHPPAWDLGGNRRPDLVDGTVGRRAIETAWSHVGVRPGRRRRVRAVRPVLVRDHPPVRGVRVLRRGRGRRLRDERSDRARRASTRSPPTAASCRSATVARRCSCCSG